MSRTSAKLETAPRRGLSRLEAAQYIGVGATLFDAMVADGRMPRAKRINDRVVWDRYALDMAFSDLPDAKENAFDSALRRRAEHA